MGILEDIARRRAVLNKNLDFSLPDIAPSPPPKAVASFGDRVTDFGADVLKVPGNVASAAAGLANLPFAPLNVAPFEFLEKGAKNVNAAIGDKIYSDARKQEEADVQNAFQSKQNAGLWEQLKAGAGAAIDNPAVAVGHVPTILAEMLAGSKGARYLMPNAKALTAGAVGEGAVAAGHISANIGGETDDEFRRLMALPAGAVTAAIPMAGGSLLSKMAQQSGVMGRVGRAMDEAVDPETLLAGGTRAGSGSLLQRMAAGGFREGALEEMPQSFAESVMSNVALDKPWMQGAGVDAGYGGVLGAGFGAGFNIRGPQQSAPTETAPGQEAQPAQPAGRQVIDTPETDHFTTLTDEQVINLRNMVVQRQQPDVEMHPNDVAIVELMDRELARRDAVFQRDQKFSQPADTTLPEMQQRSPEELTMMAREAEVSRLQQSAAKAAAEGNTELAKSLSVTAKALSKKIRPVAPAETAVTEEAAPAQDEGQFSTFSDDDLITLRNGISQQAQDFRQQFGVDRPGDVAQLQAMDAELSSRQELFKLMQKATSGKEAPVPEDQPNLSNYAPGGVNYMAPSGVETFDDTVVENTGEPSLTPVGPVLGAKGLLATAQEKFTAGLRAKKDGKKEQAKALFAGAARLRKEADAVLGGEAPAAKSTKAAKPEKAAQPTKPVTPKQARKEVSNLVSSGVIDKKKSLELGTLAISDPAAAMAEIARIKTEYETTPATPLPGSANQPATLQGAPVVAQPEQMVTQEGETQGAENAGAIVVGESGSMTVPPELTGNQRAVYTSMATAVLNNEFDKYLQSDGSLNYTKIAEDAGANTRQAGYAAIKQTVDKILKDYGLDKATAKKMLKARNVAARKVEAHDEDKLGLSPAEQNSVIETEDLFGENQSMGLIEGVSGSQSAIGVEDKEATTMALARPDPVAEKRVAEAAARKAAQDDWVLSQPEAGEAAADWDDMRSDTAPTAAQLNKQDAAEWVLTYLEWKNGDITEEQLNAEQRDFERRYEAEPAGERARLTDSGGIESPGSPARQEAVVADTKPAVAPPKVKVKKTRTAATPAAQPDALSKAPEDWTPTEVINRLGILRRDKQHKAIAESYLAQARAGEDVLTEAAKWVTAVNPELAPVPDNGTKYSINGALEAEVATWKQTVAAYKNGELDGVRTAHTLLSSTPASMQLLGMPDMPVMTHNHSLDYLGDRVSTAQMEQLPALMADPKAVFAMDDTKGDGYSFVFVTGLTTADGFVLVALKPNTVQQDVRANYVATVMTKPLGALLREARDGHALYVGDVSGIAGMKGALDIGRQKNGREAATVRKAISQRFALPTTLSKVMYRSDLVKLIDAGTAKYSSAEAPQGQDATKLEAKLKKFFSSPYFFSRAVEVVQDENDPRLPASERQSLSKTPGKVQGFFADGKVWMIANNIAEGKELAVLLHEVGVHMGMKNLLGQQNYDRLITQLQTWVLDGTGAEGVLAKRAMSRVKNAETLLGDAAVAAAEEEFGAALPKEVADNIRKAAKLSKNEREEELLAYFVEEAVNTGMDPTAVKGAGKLQQWFRTFVASVKALIAKLGMDASKVTAQDVVDLAYGAANMEFGGYDKGIAGRGRVRSVGPVEQGAGGLSGPEDVLQYYAGGQSAGAGSTILGTDQPGAEIVQWGEPYGPYKDVVTIAFTAEDGSHYTVLTTAKLLQDAAMKPGSQKYNILSDAALQIATAIPVEGRDNVYAASVYGPNRGGAAYEYAKSVGGVTDIATQVGNGRTVKNTRLEGIPFAALRRLQKEARRRVTRARDGRVPNMVTVRTSGANIGRREFYPADVVQRKFSIAPSANPKVAAAMADIGASFAAVSPKLLTNFQLHDQHKGDMPTLTTHMALLDQMSVRQQQIVNASHPIMEKWSTFMSKSKESAQRLHQVMQDATLRGMHPDEALGTGGNDHLTAKDKAAYDELKSRYMALPQAAKDIYQEAKKMLADNWQLRREIYNEMVRDAYKDDLAAAAKNPKELVRINKIIDKNIKDHDAQIKELKGPYFPLMRFGDYLVVAESPELTAKRAALATASGAAHKTLLGEIAVMERNPKHYQASAYERASERDAEHQRLTAAGMTAHSTKAKDFSKQTQSMSFATMEMLNKKLSKEFDSGTTAKLRQIVTGLALASTPEHSALQRQIKRKGVSGASLDMLRAFAESVESDSFHLSRMEKMKDISSNLHAMGIEASKAGGPLVDVYNNVVRRMEMDFTSERSPTAAFLSRLSSFFHLGVAPSYLLTNMTQPFMITSGHLAGRFGARRSIGALSSAWMDATKIIKAGKKGNWFADVDFAATLQGNELALATYLYDLGKLSIANNVDTEMYTGGMNPKLVKLAKVFNWATHHIELTNRLTTALATYRLELPKAGHAAAMDKAREAIELTQLTYDDTNAAYFMKANHLGGWNRIPMQFKKYQQGMVYLLFREGKKALAGDKDALKALGYLLTTQLAFAGARGLPIAFPIFLLAGLLGDDDDEEGDLETKARNYLTDSIGTEPARALWSGLPTLFGANLSNNLGMGNLLNPAGMLQARDLASAATGKEAIKEIGFNVAGAPVGMLSKFADAMVLAGHGDIGKAFEQSMPKFIASPLKAARYGTDGLTTRRGNEAVAAEDFDAWDLTLKALGFSPVTESEHYAGKQAVEDRNAAKKDRRNRLITMAANGRDVQEQIDAFNAAHPNKADRITRATILKSKAQKKRVKNPMDDELARFALIEDE